MASHEKKNHGLYSSKVRMPMSSDGFGKAISFNCTAAPYYEPKGATFRPDASKGKQVLTKANHTTFDKVKYAEEPYDPEKKEKVRKTGFGTGRELSRDDLSSTLEVGRYRHHLMLERRQEQGMMETVKHQLEEFKAETARSGGAGEASGTLSATRGLASTIPRFEHEFDRQRHVSEFNTRRFDPSVKNERVHGTQRPISTDFGEGCFDMGRLQSPTRGIKKPGGMTIAHPTSSILVPGIH